MASLGSGMIYAATNVLAGSASANTSYTVPAGYVFVGQGSTGAGGSITISSLKIIDASSSLPLIVGSGVTIGINFGGTFAVISGILMQNP